VCGLVFLKVTETLVFMMNPLKFFSQVKQESGKVTWPSKQETISVTMVVLVMVGIAAVFFTVVDWAIYSVIGRILGY
jgi:preprotein translocase subunit SecE